MDTNETIAAVSALGSIAAALWARSSLITAKKALKLAELESISKQEELSTYLVDALKWRDSNSNPFLSASCSITNSSASPTTINRIELLVHAYNQEGSSQPLLIPARSAKPENSDFSLIDLPVNLDPRASISGWLSFRFPEAIRNCRVERYEVIFHTWSGQKSTLNIYQVKGLS